MTSYLRLVGLLFLALAFMAAGADAIGSREAGTVKIRSLGELWGILHFPSRDAFLAWGDAKLPPVAMDPVISSVMAVPAWVLFAVIGAGLLYLFRQRRQTPPA